MKTNKAINILKGHHYEIEGLLPTIPRLSDKMLSATMNPVYDSSYYSIYNYFTPLI